MLKVSLVGQSFEQLKHHLSVFWQKQQRPVKEEAARVSHGGLREGLRQDVSPEGSPALAHGRETVRLQLDLLREALHPERRASAASQDTYRCTRTNTHLHTTGQKHAQEEWNQHVCVFISAELINQSNLLSAPLILGKTDLFVFYLT